MRFPLLRILRTRDPALLKGCDIVVDVGEEYNPVAHRYDLPKSRSVGVCTDKLGILIIVLYYMRMTHIVLFDNNMILPPCIESLAVR